MTPQFGIGTRYIPRGKNKAECEVVDIHTTYNSQNEIVKIRYVSTHMFCGQVVTASDVVAPTIGKGLVERVSYE